MKDPLQDIMEERARQDAQWGEQNHTPEWWLVILGEEYGEACEGALHAHTGFDPGWSRYRKEMVHVAAVALAALECYERRKWEQP